MGYSLIQLRIEDQLKTQANKLFDNLGLDMSTAVIGNLKCSKIGNKSTVFQEDKYLSLW